MKQSYDSNRLFNKNNIEIGSNSLEQQNPSKSHQELKIKLENLEKLFNYKTEPLEHLDLDKEASQKKHDENRGGITALLKELFSLVIWQILINQRQSALQEYTYFINTLSHFQQSVINLIIQIKQEKTSPGTDAFYLTEISSLRAQLEKLTKIRDDAETNNDELKRVNYFLARHTMLIPDPSANWEYRLKLFITQSGLVIQKIKGTFDSLALDANILIFNENLLIYLSKINDKLYKIKSNAHWKNYLISKVCDIETSASNLPDVTWKKEKENQRLVDITQSDAHESPLVNLKDIITDSLTQIKTLIEEGNAVQSTIILLKRIKKTYRQAKELQGDSQQFLVFKKAFNYFGKYLTPLSEVEQLKNTLENLSIKIIYNNLATRNELEILVDIISSPEETAFFDENVIKNNLTTLVVLFNSFLKTSNTAAQITPPKNEADQAIAKKKQQACLTALETLHDQIDIFSKIQAWQDVENNMLQRADFYKKLDWKEKYLLDGVISYVKPPISQDFAQQNIVESRIKTNKNDLWEKAILIQEQLWGSFPKLAERKAGGDSFTSLATGIAAVLGNSILISNTERTLVPLLLQAIQWEKIQKEFGPMRSVSAESLSNDSSGQERFYLWSGSSVTPSTPARTYSINDAVD